MFNKICQVASLLSLILSGSMAAFGFVAIRYMQSPEFERDLNHLNLVFLDLLSIFFGIEYKFLSLEHNVRVSMLILLCNPILLP